MPDFVGAPDTIRTCDLCLRSATVEHFLLCTKARQGQNHVFPRTEAMDNDRFHAVISILADYVKSPSFRHIRDSRNLQKLAREIIQSVDRTGAVWGKWEGRREEVAKAAACCWIPTDDLMTFLNRLPGPALTHTDVAQRLRAFWEEHGQSIPMKISRRVASHNTRLRKRRGQNCRRSSARFGNILSLRMTA
jgi:hypothetical protein